LSKPKRSTGSSYLKYSGIAFQMFAILLAGWWGGSKLDQYFALEKPYIALALMFIFLIGYLTKLYLDVTKGRL